MTSRKRILGFGSLVGLLVLLLVISLSKGFFRVDESSSDGEDGTSSATTRVDGVRQGDKLVLEAKRDSSDLSEVKQGKKNMAATEDKNTARSPSASARQKETNRANTVGETDYSQYDTDPSWGMKVEQVGITQAIPTTYMSSQPSVRARQRMREIEKGHEEAIAKGLLRDEPREGYVRREFDKGRDVVYVEPGFLTRFDALTNEYRQLNEGSMRPEPGMTYTGAPELGRTLLDDTELRYYRRRSDGSLMRAVTFPNGVEKTWVIGPPPDPAVYPDNIIAMSRKSWR